MNFKKLVNLDVRDANVYFLETVQDKILINDAFNGIVVLSDSLSSIADVPLLDYLKITWVFKKVTEDALLFYCYESLCLIYLSMHDFSSKIINLPKSEYKGQKFFPIYYWAHDDIFLTTDTKIHKVDLLNEVVSPVAETEIEESHFEFYKVWRDFKEYEVLFYDPKEYALIFKEDASLVFESYDLMRKRRVIKELDQEGPILDAIYHTGEVAIAHKNAVSITSIKSGAHLVLKPELPYVFEKIRFVGESYKKMVVLARDTSRSKHDHIEVYEMEK